MSRGPRGPAARPGGVHPIAAASSACAGGAIMASALARAARAAARRAGPLARRAPPPLPREACVAAAWLLPGGALRHSSQVAAAPAVAEEDAVRVPALCVRRVLVQRVPQQAVASFRGSLTHCRASHAGAAQAAQHRHLGAHRQREDNADGAHPVLHRAHPRDPRGARAARRSRRNCPRNCLLWLAARAMLLQREPFALYAAHLRSALVLRTWHAACVAPSSRAAQRTLTLKSHCPALLGAGARQGRRGCQDGLHGSGA